ncbi:CBS domain-containing protein [Candidatus Nitrospira bockiana]
MELITTHLNADFDGLASMVAVRKLYPQAILSLPAGAQEAVRGFLAVHDLGLRRPKDVPLGEVTRLILVDTHDPDRLGPFKGLYEDPRVVLEVYDHHPSEKAEGEAGRRPAVELIEPVGATTTILIEHLMRRQISLTPFEATVLALGLYEETGFLAFTSTTPRDLEAAAHVLRAGADLNVVTDTLRRPLAPDQIALMNDLLHHAETLYVDGCKVLFAASVYDRYRGDLAEVVQKLAEMEGLDATVCVIALEEKVEVIARSRREDFDVGALARELGGGGHAVAAAATVKGRTLIEVREQVLDWLAHRMRPILLARDVMTTPAKVAAETMTVAAVEGALTKYEVNAMPVVDARDRYRGIITRETVQKALFHKFHKVPIADFLQTEVYTAGLSTPFREVEQRMLERNQRFVPVLDEDRVAGVITRTDLLRALHHDIAATTRIRPKGEERPFPSRSRNVRGHLKAHLPAPVFERLRQAGDLAERLGVSAFVVGGFVRDLLLGRPNLDLDLVIEGDGIAFAEALAREWQASVKTHDRFGTAVVTLPDGVKLDIATARTEYYEYPTALPTVERSSIKKDLYRRDFTINTLAVRLNTRRFGELLDFYGGQQDLKDKLIRVLHSLSFVEDPTRVFRAVRFEHRFGFRLGKETLALIKGAVKMDLFRRLSGSRLLTELMLLLSEEEPRRAVARLAELDLLRFLHPKLQRQRQLEARLKPVEDALDWYRLLYLDRPIERWLVYFMALMDLLPPDAVRETVKRLHLRQRHAEKLHEARTHATAILRRLGRRPPPKPAEVYRLLEGLSDEVLLFLLAKTSSEAVKRQISAYLTTYRQVRPALTGRDLQAAGVKPGPIYREILDRLLEGRLNGELTSEADERALVTRLIARAG